MAFMDKLKSVTNKALETVESATQATKEGYNKIKEENNAKKAEREAYIAEMNEKTEAYAATLSKEMKDNTDGLEKAFYTGFLQSEILTFTKDFYEKMVLPGSKASLSCILMYPYIDEKRLKTLQKDFPNYDGIEPPVLCIKESDKQQFLLTKEKLYFKVFMPDDKKFYAYGSITCVDICNINIVSDTDRYFFTVNNVRLTELSVRDTYKQDFMALNRYFDNIMQQDYDITPEEIDQLIQQKIGDKIYQHIKKYMTFEDELVMYYAGGLDSLLAMDYIACTTKQIIIVNREMFGATSNVKQFYYEDITAMATEQNSKAEGLLWQAIDSALTAALKVCDLIITVAGAKEKISTLYTIEAQRVVAIYHQYRKELKQGNQPVQTIVQSKEPDVYEQLEKLKKLKDNGIISESEFDEKRKVLLERL